MTHKEGSRTSSFKLCISVSAQTLELLSQRMKKARGYKPDFLELRLDHILNLNQRKLKQVGKLLKGNEFLTIRSRLEGGKFHMPERKRVSMIRNCLLSLKPKFIDVEISTINKYPQILRDAEETRTKLIASFHDLKGNENLGELRKVLWQAPLGSKSLHAIKIVSKARTAQDNRKVLSLYSSKLLKGKNAPKLVAFCTGEKGIGSRIRCLFLGSPFSYCSLPGEPLASGQLDIESMREAIAKREVRAN